MFIINNYLITITLYILFLIIAACTIYKLTKKIEIYNSIQPVKVLFKRPLIKGGVYIGLFLILLTLYRAFIILSYTDVNKLTLAINSTIIIYFLIIIVVVYLLISFFSITDKGIVILGRFEVPIDIISWANVINYEVSTNKVLISYVKNNKEKKIGVSNLNREDKLKIISILDDLNVPKV